MLPFTPGHPKGSVYVHTCDTNVVQQAKKVVNWCTDNKIILLLVNEYLCLQVVAGAKKIETKTIDSSMEKIGEDGQVQIWCKGQQFT